MDRAQKQESIEDIKSVFASSGAVVVTHNLGLTVAEMTDLRNRLRKEGATLKCVWRDAVTPHCGPAIITHCMVLFLTWYLVLCSTLHYTVLIESA